MRKMKPEQVLESIRLSMLEDLGVYSPLDACVVFFKKKDDGIHFQDYEMAQTEEPEIDLDWNDDEQKSIQDYLELKEKGCIVPGLTNAIYPDESYEIMSLKEALTLVAMLEYLDYSSDVIITYVNMWIRDVTPYRLAQILGISKQSMSQFLNGIRPIPLDRKKQIAELLKFDIAEYDIELTEYKFDDTDV